MNRATNTRVVWEAKIWLSGWWFGTFFIFPYVGNLIIPIDFHIFQRGGPTTNQLYYFLLWDGIGFDMICSPCHWLMHISGIIQHGMSKFFGGELGMNWNSPWQNMSQMSTKICSMVIAWHTIEDIYIYNYLLVVKTWGFCVGEKKCVWPNSHSYIT